MCIFSFHGGFQWANQEFIEMNPSGFAVFLDEAAHNVVSVDLLFDIAENGYLCIAEVI